VRKGLAGTEDRSSGDYSVIPAAHAPKLCNKIRLVVVPGRQLKMS
jgi:hypothetical protein